MSTLSIKGAYGYPCRAVAVEPAHREAGRGFRALAARAGMALVDLLLAWQERASTRTQLGRLDDRMLRDIGISRADADAEASKPFWRA